MHKEKILRSEVLKAVEKYHRYKNEISDDKSNKIDLYPFCLTQES